MQYTFNHEDRSITDVQSGKTITPSCFNDLAPYVAYLCGRGHNNYAERIIGDVFRGELVISKMIANSQKHQNQGDFKR